jgi:AcrR family transcriptional regulator
MDVEAHVRRLWRHRGTTPPAPRRGPRQQLTLDALLDAAVEVADAAGLGGLSTRAVAARLGVSAMGLYSYVGSRDQMVALMQDHASAIPAWTDPGTSLAADLAVWAEQLFDLYLAHPWLTEIPWAEASGGPNEQDWLERLLGILDHWEAPGASRAAVVTALYATVRAAAQTAAAYRGLAHSDRADQWLNRARATRQLIDDYPQRYPLSLRLEPHEADDWQDAPRASLRSVVEVISRGLAAA